MEDKFIGMIFEYKHTWALVLMVSLSCFLIPIFGYWIFLMDVPELYCAIKEIQSKFPPSSDK